MKKMLLVLLTLGVIFSCGKKEEAKTETETTKTETTTTATPTDAAATDVPTFKEPEVQKYVDSYQEYIKNLKDAVASKDATKIQELTTKSQELATQGAEAAKKLTDPAEAKKFADYMTKLGQEATEEMTKMAKKNDRSRIRIADMVSYFNLL